MQEESKTAMEQSSIAEVAAVARPESHQFLVDIDDDANNAEYSDEEEAAFHGQYKEKHFA